MANKEKIDYLLSDIRELEKIIDGMRDADLYPVSFFSQTFELSRKIINDLHCLETEQVEMLHQQMEEHKKLIQSIPMKEAVSYPLTVSDHLGQPETALSNESVQPVIPAKEEVTTVVADQPVKETTIVPLEEETDKETVVSSNPKTAVLEKTGISLNEILERKNLSDFRKAFSLNDRFRFRRELFGGNEEAMNKTVSALNDIHSYEESIAYLHDKLNWNIEDPSVADFIKLLEKRFL